jgi:hypothetical protein
MMIGTRMGLRVGWMMMMRRRRMRMKTCHGFMEAQGTFAGACDAACMGAWLAAWALSRVW